MNNYKGYVQDLTKDIEELNSLNNSITTQRKKIYDLDTKELNELHKSEASLYKQIAVDFDVLRTLNVKRLEMLYQKRF